MEGWGSIRVTVGASRNLPQTRSKIEVFESAYSQESIVYMYIYTLPHSVRGPYTLALPLWLIPSLCPYTAPAVIVSSYTFVLFPHQSQCTVVVCR